MEIKIYKYPKDTKDLLIRDFDPNLIGEAVSAISDIINDIEENIKGLLDYCLKAEVKGIICFDIGLTLRSGNREYFYKQLDRHFPKLKEKYIRTYGNSYQITSKNSSKLMKIITDVCRKNGIMHNINEVFAYLHKFESKEEQLTLFDMG